MGVALLISVGGCRAHPRVGRRIVVADTREASECWDQAQQNYEQCMFLRGRHGLCLTTRDTALMECPGARDMTGQSDPSVVQLPGFRP